MFIMHRVWIIRTDWIIADNLLLSWCFRVKKKSWCLLSCLA